MANTDGPVAKRRKVESERNYVQPTASRLFAPFRTVGLVSPTAVPFTSVPLGNTTFQITTSVGRSLQTYDLKRGLNLVFLSRPQCPGKITATCAFRDRVFAAWNGTASGTEQGVWIFKRGKLIGELESTKNTQKIERILVFGNWIIGCGAKAIEVWKNDSYEYYTTIYPASHSLIKAKSFSGNVCTLPTYLNKIFVGGQDGQVEVYNVRTGKLVHTIHAPSTTSGSVTSITAASTLCTLAVAYADGTLFLYDADTDDRIMNMRDSKSRPITSITFRSDGVGGGEDGRKDGIMATASTESGDITIWDLNRGGKIAGVLRGAHESSNSRKDVGITKIDFLSGQPVIVSSGLDNAVRTWIFDQTPFSAIPRILHARSGHAAPVTKLNFLPAASDGSEASGKWLLSAGQDRSLWGFSLRKDGQNMELSQGHVKHKAKKMGQLLEDASGVENFKAPQILDMACSLNRDGGMGTVSGGVWTNTRSANAEESALTGWESIVTAHVEDRFARTWSWGRKKAGRWAFESGDHRPVTSVAVTACGTFAVVGSAGGSLDMFNLQSGMHRQRFPPRLKPSQAKQLINGTNSSNLVDAHRGHKDAITGIVVDNLNETLLSSSLDGTIIFWEFSSGRVIHRLVLESSATSLKYNSVSGLVALSCEDLCIRIIDVETRKIVRELWGCVGQISSICFSHDGRWIVACSMDSVIRVFDLATGHLVDAFKTNNCTNVAFSSTGEYLATTHAGALGINIWSNKSLFASVFPRQIDENNGIIDLRDVEEFETSYQYTLGGYDDNVGKSTPDVDTEPEIDQLDESLLTLSLVPRSRWQTLLNLDSIRQRNKPIQPPEKPKAAPFFLGSSLATGASERDASVETHQQTAIHGDSHSRLSRIAEQESSQSRISDLISAVNDDLGNSVAGLISHLALLPPSAADLDIRSLTIEEMPVFVRAMTVQLRLRREFELVNAWMSVFLKMHGDFVSELEDLRLAILEWRQVMLEEEKRLDGLLSYTKGVVEFLRSAR